MQSSSLLENYIHQIQIRRQFFLYSIFKELKCYVKCSYEAAARELPDFLQDLETTYLTKRTAMLQGQGKTVDYNDTYSLRQLRVERPQLDGTLFRERRNTVHLVFEPSNFKYNLMINEALDTSMWPDVEERYDTIRKRLGLSGFEWSKIPDIKFHLWFSTVIGVITADHQFVVALRSGLQAIKDNNPDDSFFRASMSAAEGMLRPVDSESPPPSDLPSPFKTAERALEYELGLTAGDHYLREDIELISMCFDTHRYQPLAVFFLQLRSIGFEGVLKHWAMAHDRHENYALFPVAATAQSFALLLKDEVRYEGRRIKLFSNHQKIGATLTGIRFLGMDAMGSALV
jgi:hypothetical protein